MYIWAIRRSELELNSSRKLQPPGVCRRCRLAKKCRLNVADVRPIVRVICDVERINRERKDRLPFFTFM
jgi:hypothetical protein